MINPSNRSRTLQAAAVVGMQALAQQLSAQGHILYPLVLGESDLPTPAHIVAAGQQALADGYTYYPPGLGYLELREAVAAKLHSYNKLDVDPGSQIFTTNGSGLGLSLALLAVLNPGDEVLVSAATYGPFIDGIRLVGAKPIFVPQPSDDAGQPRWVPVALEGAISPRSRAIIINTPSAPAGTVLTTEELGVIANCASKHNLTIISDEVFETLLYDDHQHQSIAALGDEIAARTITVFSFSKSYAMTGWRLGYTVAPADTIATMERLSMAFGRPAAAFTQKAGVAALNGPQQFISEMNQIYTHRREQVALALQSIPSIRWTRPEGAFYYYLDFSSIGKDSVQMAERLLREAHVVLTPGTFYGPAGQGWLRLSFAGDLATTLRGIEALSEAVGRWFHD